ncbi:MCE family protein [Mycolicibacterium vinylchloridicum]|uniref:MCE family protein n=1 Tax=Mycolicibacterium vinylchloridicum TaxID=2736928 RepID=UPI0015CB0189|nr:MCE family protein [Mycolicibacterium vinylchloridicum]
MMPARSLLLRVGAFTTVMVLLTGFLFLVFGQYRTGSSVGYRAVFADVSRLKPGDTVRIAGVKVGAVEDVSLRNDMSIEVSFNTDRAVSLTQGTRAEVRYLNLVGDRYLELVEGPGNAKILPANAEIPKDRTAPALDIDMLLGGLKPVIRGLNPDDVNSLTATLVHILQGEGGNVESLFAQTASLTNTLADHNDVLMRVIDSLKTLLTTLSAEGNDFSGAIDRLEKLVTGLSHDREPLGDAIVALSQGTASLTDLLGASRTPLAGAVDQLNRLAPGLDEYKDRIDTAFQKAPENYRKLARVGSYGSFINYYVCSLTFRVTDLQGRTAVFPMLHQDTGRCAEN